ncbi:MAG TPA: NAD-dependent epimerase/dehydratase family protein, partial [Gammaproteobacteria bacterium]|nr:NAD-dependent epimerase/dehydratase family protein [Gammaproteobacteria bacterium]
DQPLASGLIDIQNAWLYYLAPPPASGVNDTRMCHFTVALTGDETRPPPERAVLISTTGIYGDCAGDWITEDRPAAPLVDRARRRVDAEQVFTGWAQGIGTSAVILRVPGIYGPNRLPLKRLQSGAPVLSETESPWSNRIHATDLVRSCMAVVRHDNPAAIYNICDGHPSTMTDYFNQVADYLGLARPPVISRTQADKQLTAGMLSYLAESKRIDNSLMREHLGVDPVYPDLAAGLLACKKTC